MTQYNNANPAPSFVLIVGDTPQISASYSSGGHVSDLDYCDMTNNGIPDILMGRFSAQTPTQLLTQIEKTIEYEKKSDGLCTRNIDWNAFLKKSGPLIDPSKVPILAFWLLISHCFSKRQSLEIPMESRSQLIILLSTR